MNKEPVLVFASILAALQIFFAGTAATSVVVDANEVLTLIFAFGALAVGAAQAGLQFYVRGQVTENSKVLEWVDSGQVIAGPANDVVTPGHTVRGFGTLRRQEASKRTL